MKPEETGRSYDKIAGWWDEKHKQSEYGLDALKKAAGFCTSKVSALDIGCGAGGRFVSFFEQEGFDVTGIDISEEMVKLASVNHPRHRFIFGDICTWETSCRFDLVTAWDSIFHLPLDKHKDVISKMCGMLNPGGVVMYTLGDDTGEHTDEWMSDTFYYSSIGINGNIKALTDSGMAVKHVEMDQFPLNHVFIIAVKH